MKRTLIRHGATSLAIALAFAAAGDGVARTAAPLVASHESRAESAHVQRAPLPASQRAPHSIDARDANRADYDGAAKLLHKSRPSAAKAAAVAAAACNATAFGGLSGTALADAVKAADVDCINELFGLSGNDAYRTFREAQMTTIANAFASAASSYDGTNSSGILQLVLFLRAGYYVQFYDSAVGAYGATLKTAVRTALDRFAANSNFGRVNDAHGETLAEFVTLIDSSAENARYLYVVKRMLSSYNTTYAQYYWMESAVNNTFLVLFRGHQNDDFRTLVQSDTSIVGSLYDFANAHFSELGTDTDYLVSNAGRELGRFLQYSGALKTLAQSRAKALLDRSSVTGPTASLWVGIGEMVDYYDKANCAYYSLCDFQQRLEANVLPISHSCSSTLKLRAQAMTSAQLAGACTTLTGQEAYFHQQAATGNRPVANDNNTALEMVVFNSSSDYRTYAGALFGIDTNNGGMYLEGNPSAAGNQARFIAYEAEWVLPAFEIWNLTHEYVHYLDGRFNMYGDFGAAMSQKTVWWVEGFAEYMSYSYRNLAYSGAQSEAAAGTYTLSRVFQNDYSSGQTLVYNWGYLGVRFMFEKHRGDVSSILGYFRPGDYTGYATFMSGLGTRYDTEFRNWLPCVGNPAGPGCGGTANQPPTAAFSFAANGLAVSFTDGSSDPDGSIASRSWDFGDGTTSTAANPTKQYSAAGTYTVTLTVRDNASASATTTRSVTVTANQPPTAAFSFAANGLAVTFTDGSSDPDGSIASRSWDFGDGTTSTAANPTKQYSAAGTYTVTLTVRDNASASATTTRSVTVAANPGTTVLANGVPVGGLAGARNSERVFSIDVPAGASNLRFTTSGGSGDLDLYVKRGAAPTTSNADCSSRGNANAESCVVASPQAGTYYVKIVGYTAYSGATLVASYTTGGSGVAECTASRTDELGKNCKRSNLSGAAGAYTYLYLYIPANTPQLRITASGGTGNADLYYSSSTWATTGNYQYRSATSGNNETIVVANPPEGYVYVSLYGAAAYSGVQVTTEY